MTGVAAGDAGGAVGLGEAVRVAGIGCRKGVSAEEVLAAVAAVGGADVMAVVRAKAEEPGVVEAAARSGLPLRVAAGRVDRGAAADAVGGFGGGGGGRVGLRGGGAGGGGAGGRGSSGRGWWWGG